MQTKDTVEELVQVLTGLAYEGLLISINSRGGYTCSFTDVQQRFYYAVESPQLWDCLSLLLYYSDKDSQLFGFQSLPALLSTYTLTRRVSLENAS